MNKKYRQIHKEEMSVYQKEYYQKHRKRILNRTDAYRRKHKQMFRFYSKRYSQTHKEEVRNSAKRFRWSAKSKAISHNYKARKRGASGIITDKVIERIEYLNVRKYGILTCDYCKIPIGKHYHLEHKLPLIKGGTNRQVNLCIACPQCNWQKGVLTSTEFRARLRAV